jgi:uncharacterized membrane protein YhaH (DUF805 family)
MGTIFGEVTAGRIGRLGYLGYSLLVALVVGGGLAALAVGILGTRRLMEGDLVQGRLLLHESVGLALGFVAGLALLLFAELNLTAKRIRDMGLPGWRTLLVAMAVVAAVDGAAGAEAAGGLQTLGSLALLLVPRDGFALGA